jgi:hypothetical protein
MDPINKLTRLLEALRLQQSRSGEVRSEKSATATDAARTASQSSSAVPVKLSLEQLNRRIGERISKLAPDERHGDRALQQFVDSVLAWEFGEDFLDSDAFTQYSKKVSAAIRSDSRLSGEFKLFLKSLP